MLPNKPKLVHSELKKVLEHHVKDYWIINCSNVKPHVYYLDFIANMWRDGDVDIDKHLKAISLRIMEKTILLKSQNASDSIGSMRLSMASMRMTMQENSLQIM